MNQHSSQSQDEDIREESSGHRHPVDSGWRAWAVVVASFVYEGLQWGFPLSFGVFQNYYISQNTFDDASKIPLIGILSTSILYLGSPLMTAVVDCIPQYRVHLIWLGWFVQVIAIVAASFANSVTVLIVTQGFMYGLGDLVVYMPMMSLINDWFEKRRGLAYGIVDASTGLTGIAYPFILEALLHRYGPKTTLRAFAVFFFAATAPVLPLIRLKVTDSDATEGPRRISTWSIYRQLFRKPLFHIYSISNLFQGLGFFFPSLFLPTFASSLGYSRNMGALLISMLSLAQMLGQITFGWLSDRNNSHLHLLLVSSSFISGIATLLLWGLAKSLAPLIVYSLVFGFFASGYVVFWARMGTRLTDDAQAQITTYGLFSAQRGLGNILEGPISGALWKQGDLQSNKYGLGSYADLVAFSGALLISSSITVVSWDLYVYGRGVLSARRRRNANLTETKES